MPTVSKKFTEQLVSALEHFTMDGMQKLEWTFPDYTISVYRVGPVLRIDVKGFD